MKFKIQNLGVQTIMVSSASEMSICPVKPNEYSIVADTVKDELLAVYGASVISVIGTTGYNDSAAPVYHQFTATNSWVLVDLLKYCGIIQLKNLNATNDIAVSFSGFLAPATDPPASTVITVVNTAAAYTHPITINRVMNPERYMMIKCSAGSPILEVIGS